MPEADGALRPVLEALADYLTEADPSSLPLVQTALQVSDAFLTGAGSGAAAAPAWARLLADRQDVPPFASVCGSAPSGRRPTHALAPTTRPSPNACRPGPEPWTICSAR